MHHSALQRIRRHHMALQDILQCITSHHSALQRITMHYNALQDILKCIIKHHSASQRTTAHHKTPHDITRHLTVHHKTSQRIIMHHRATQGSKPAAREPTNPGRNVTKSQKYRGRESEISRFHAKVPRKRADG